MDAAFAALSELAKTHAWNYTLKFDPYLDELRKDHRFAEFCAKVGIAL